MAVRRVEGRTDGDNRFCIPHRPSSSLAHPVASHSSERKTPMTIAAALQAEPGEVFTRRWVVETILDLVGYTSDRDLATMRIVEPSIGFAVFFISIAEQPLKSL